MNKEMFEKTKSAITLCKIRLENLKSRLEESHETNIVYNRLLIEKAVLEHNIKPNGFAFINKFKRLFTRKENKRICDYFKNNVRS